MSNDALYKKPVTRNPKSTMPSGLGGVNVDFYEFVIRKIAQQKLPDPPPQIIRTTLGLEAIQA